MGTPRRDRAKMARARGRATRWTTIALACVVSAMCVFGGATNVRAEEDATTDAGAAKIPDFAPGAEKFEFQAEVSRLMDIIINSLYSNKDIFLRELISNGSDSLDKIRFMSLTDKEQLGSGENADLDIRIKADKERKVLTIRDRGIGMTKDDLMNNLGMIAKSGTSAFLDQMASGGDMSLIGQFGVGFYSVYLVADFVEVRSKHNDDDKQWVWQSKADGNFAISEDEGEPLGRGVEINIYLKEEAQEYLEETKLQALVERYSEFINFPIYLYNSKEVSEDDQEEARSQGDAEDDDAKPEGEDDAATKDEPKYEKFWKSFGKAIKLGIIEDASNRVRLAKLLRFQTSKSDGKLVSLEQYVERMKEGQKSIYYITGESIDALKNSPFLEKLISKDFEVIYFTDPIDEYTMQNLTEFDDFKFSNASKEDLKFGDADDDEKARFKKTKEAFKSFTTWWKSKLPDTMIEAVKVSNRLSTTPCVVVSSKYGWSANMERIMKAQAMGDESRHEYMRGKKTLEVNPRHPMIAALKERAATDPDSEETETLAKLMFETAKLESGFSFDKPQEYTSRVFDLLKSNMGIEKDAELVDETQFHLPEEEDEEDKKEETKEETKEAPKDEL